MSTTHTWGRDWSRQAYRLVDGLDQGDATKVDRAVRRMVARGLDADRAQWVARLLPSQAGFPVAWFTARSVTRRMQDLDRPPASWDDAVDNAEDRARGGENFRSKLSEPATAAFLANYQDFAPGLIAKNKTVAYAIAYDEWLTPVFPDARTARLMQGVVTLSSILGATKVIQTESGPKLSMEGEFRLHLNGIRELVSQEDTYQLIDICRQAMQSSGDPATDPSGLARAIVAEVDLAQSGDTPGLPDWYQTLARIGVLTARGDTAQLASVADRVTEGATAQLTHVGEWATDPTGRSVTGAIPVEIIGWAVGHASLYGGTRAAIRAMQAIAPVIDPAGLAAPFAPDRMRRMREALAGNPLGELLTDGIHDAVPAIARSGLLTKLVVAEVGTFGQGLRPREIARLVDAFRPERQRKTPLARVFAPIGRHQRVARHIAAAQRASAGLN